MPWVHYPNTTRANLWHKINPEDREGKPFCKLKPPQTGAVVVNDCDLPPDAYLCRNCTSIVTGYKMHQAGLQEPPPAVFYRCEGSEPASEELRTYCELHNLIESGRPLTQRKGERLRRENERRVEWEQTNADPEGDRRDPSRASGNIPGYSIRSTDIILSDRE